MHGGRNLSRKLARIAQQTEDTDTHRQRVITSLKLDEQPTLALTNQNRDNLRPAENAPVCISDGLC